MVRMVHYWGSVMDIVISMEILDIGVAVMVSIVAWLMGHVVLWEVIGV